MTGSGENPALLILAAGEGSRMRSRTPKLLHPVCDRSILRHIVRMGQELGAKPIVIVAGANQLLTPAMIDAQEAAFARAKVIVCQLESPPDAVERALLLGQRLGKTVILNPAPALGPLPTPWLAACDYLIPNETEAALLTARPVDSPQAALAAAADLHAQGARHVIITLGARGIAYVDAYTQLLMPAHPAQAIDTTAAGDTFVGALATALAEGAAPAAAIQFGQAAAAVSVTRRGAQPSIPFRSELAPVAQ